MVFVRKLGKNRRKGNFEEAQTVHKVCTLLRRYLCGRNSTMVK